MGIGNNIRNIRKEKGMTLQQIADIMGCSPQLISQYESGKRQPKLETIEKIATALGCNVSDIRGFDGSIRVKMTRELIEINRIENKIENDRENVTEEEYKVLYDYYNSDQFKENWKHISQNMKKALDVYNNMIGNVTPSGDIVYADSDVLEYNRIMDKQKNNEGFTPYDKHFISDYINKSPLVRDWFIENGLKSKEKNLERIQSAYENLNDEGREEAAKRIEELTEIERYTKSKEWFKGKMSKEEINQAVEAYLKDDTSHEPYTPTPEPPEE